MPDAVFPFPGGKSRLASWILEYVPDYTCFVEVFGGAAVAFWGVFEYRVRPLSVLFVFLPTGCAIWMVWKLEVLYDFSEGMQAGGWLRGWPVTVGLLVVGFFAAVWGTQGLLAFPWFEGGTNTLSYFVGLLAGLGQFELQDALLL